MSHLRRRAPRHGIRRSDTPAQHVLIEPCYDYYMRGANGREPTRLMSEPRNMVERRRPVAPSEAAVGLSIVVPLFNEAGGLAGLHARISEVARRLRATRGLACEVVYVDDGSR